MPSKEEIGALLRRFNESMPRNVLSKIEKTNIGIGVALRYLAEANRPVTAGEISRYMNVSTARVAVILRTMCEKGLIEKSGDTSDARKVRICLSEKGRAAHRQANDEIFALLAEIVQKVGMERMETYLQISSEINAVVTAKFAEKRE